MSIAILPSPRPFIDVAREAVELGAIPQFNPATGVIELHPLRLPGWWPIGVVVKEAA